MKRCASLAIGCFVVLFVLGGIALSVQAQPRWKQRVEQREQMAFDRMDTNKDGKISLDEWKAAHPNDPNAEAQFKKLDANGDGFLTKEEFEAAAQQSKQMMEEKAKQRAAARFDAMDTNKDGKISLDEWKAAHPHDRNAEAQFKKLDTNGDGFVTKEEFEAAAQQMKTKMQTAPPPKTEGATTQSQ
jgi:Ca2+-binding EF-hand superfamily protein